MTPGERGSILAFRLLDAGLPWLSEEAREFVGALAHRAPRVVTAIEACRIGGFADRHALRRFLEREGLPGFHDLAAWLRVLVLVLEWEESGSRLSHAARAAGRSPGTYTRAVQRATGLGWLQVRSRGSPWVLVHLMQQCRPPDRDGRASAAG